MKMRGLVIMLLAVVMISTTGNANELVKEKKTVVFSVNMSCGSCVSKVEKNMPGENGVTGIKVNLEAKTVEVTFNEEKTDVKKLNAAFKKLGFTSSVVEACCGDVKEEACDEKKEAECTGEEGKEEACCGETEKEVKKKIKK